MTSQVTWLQVREAISLLHVHAAALLARLHALRCVAWRWVAQLIMLHCGISTATDNTCDMWITWLMRCYVLALLLTDRHSLGSLLLRYLHQYINTCFGPYRMHEMRTIAIDVLDVCLSCSFALQTLWTDRGRALGCKWYGYNAEYGILLPFLTLALTP